jgi:hypothetical protein
MWWHTEIISVDNNYLVVVSRCYIHVGENRQVQCFQFMVYAAEFYFYCLHPGSLIVNARQERNMAHNLLEGRL